MDKSKLKKYLGWSRYLIKFPVLEGIIFAFGVALDQISKHMVAKNNTDTDVLGKIVRFTYVKNTGAAFSLFGDWSGARVFFIVLSCLVIPAIGAFLYYSRKEGKVCRIGLSFIITGAVGNLIDRMLLGYVRDFIDAPFVFLYISNPIFNVADSFLTLGIIIFMIYFIFIHKEPKKQITNNKLQMTNEEEQCAVRSAQCAVKDEIENVNVIPSEAKGPAGMEDERSEDKV